MRQKRFFRKICRISTLFFAVYIALNINIVQCKAYNDIVFKNITMKYSLPQVPVECMIQDSRGYIWFGTNDGLCRYDGYELGRYRNESHKENSIANNYILSLMEDYRGGLCDGTIGGVSKTDIYTDEIVNYKNIAKSNNSDFSNIGSFSFVIKPPLWKSAKFIIICVVIIITIATIVLKKKNEKMKILDQMVNKRTKELMEEMNKNTELLNKVIKLEKRKNAYLVNISHELRTPLNVLSSIQQLINELNKSEEGIEREKLNHYMQIMDKNVKRLLKLINDLIDTSKIEHGNYHIDIGKHNIVYIVEDTALSLKDYVESKNIELIIDPEVEECFIECDATEIERCIINLVNNAAKFTNEGGKILVSLEEMENEVKIMVTDTGIGIEEKYLKNIFNRFNQVIDSNREVKGGSGLGLTITKLIVGLHHGSIFAESKVNEGSKFTIILPKKQPE